MRQLLPDWVPDADPVAVYGGPRPAPDGRPWVLANMITSADGSATVEARSGGLGGPPDRVVFQVLRALADVVLVAGGTARAEGYGPARLPEGVRTARQAAGRPPVPAVAVVSASLRFDWSSALFAAAEAPTLVVTTRSAPAEERAAAERVAEVVVAGEDRVDLARALAELGDRGVRLALCEGGPSLLGALLAGRLVDELCLTMAPRLVGGEGPRVVRGPALAPTTELALASVLEADGYVFLRYLTADGRAVPSGRPLAS